MVPKFSEAFIQKMMDDMDLDRAMALRVMLGVYDELEAKRKGLGAYLIERVEEQIAANLH